MRTWAFIPAALLFLATIPGCSKEALPASADFRSMKLRNLVLESEQRAKEAPKQLAQSQENRARGAEQLEEAQRLTGEARSAAQETVRSKNYRSR